MASNLAVNDAGDVLRLGTDGQWTPAQIAVNPQTGKRLVLDGNKWVDAPEPPVSASRMGGAVVRGGLTGAASVPAALLDMQDMPRRLVGQGFEKLTGISLPTVPTFSSLADLAVGALGTPAAQNATERTTETVARNVGAAIPTMAFPAARLVAGGIPTQLGGALGSGLAQAATQEAGGGQTAQTIAGVAGGLAGGLAGGAVVPAARGVAAMAAPFTQAGREAAVSDTLLRASSDPQNLGARVAGGVADDTARLPGIVPTTGQAARDPGVLQLEAGMRNQAEMGGPLREADAARNANRVEAMQAGRDGFTPDVRGATLRSQLNEAETRFGDAVRGLYQSVDPNNVARLPPGGLSARAQSVVGKYYGEGGGAVPAELRGVIDDIANASGDVSWRFMQNVRSRLGNIAGIAQRAGDNTLAAAANAIRGGIDDVSLEALASGGMTPTQYARWIVATTARKTMGERFGRDASGSATVGNILRTDQFGAPMMQDATVIRQAMATPSSVNQVIRAAGRDGDQVRGVMRGQFMDDLFNAAVMTGGTANAQGVVTPALSQAAAIKFLNERQPIAAQIFGAGEQARLKRLLADFGETAMASQTTRVAGSNTAQNLSVASMIARATNGLVDPAMPGAQTMGSLGGALSFIYRSPEAATRALLADAVADPKLAALLLSRATPESIRRASGYIDKNAGERVRELARSMATGAAVRSGTSAAAVAEPQPQ